MATLSTYKTLPGGAVQIVVPEPLSGDGGQALNDNFKSIADSVLAPGGTIGEIQYNDGSILVGAGWKMVGASGEERLVSPGTTDDGSTELQVTGAATFAGDVSAASFIGDLVGTASGSLSLTGGTITGNLTLEGTSAGNLTANGISTSNLTVSSAATVEVLECLGSIQWTSGSSEAYLGYIDGQFSYDGASFSFDCPVYFDPGSYIQSDGTGEMAISARILAFSATDGMTIGCDAFMYGNLEMQGAAITLDPSSSMVADGAGNVNLQCTTFNASGTVTAYGGDIQMGYITGGSGWAGTGLNLLAGSDQFGMVLSTSGNAYFGNTAAGTTWLEVGSAAVSCPNKLLVGGASDEGSGYCATYAGGAIAITGSGAGFQIDDRSLGSAHAWQHYATGGTFRIWNKTYGDRFTIDVSGDITAVGGVTAGGCLAVGQSSTASVIGNNSTIPTDYIGVSRVAPTSSVSGIILQADSSIKPGQHVVVVNESSYTVTFAAASSSYVADGSSSPIGGKTARAFVWDSATSLWYRCA